MGLVNKDLNKYLLKKESTFVARIMQLEKVASLIKFIETPPPTLLRAQYAIVLDHLPSVPSIVLLNKSAVLIDWAFSHFKLITIKHLN
jgi:hypothetical protein